VEFDSYADTGIHVAVDLVNALAPDGAGGKRPPSDETLAAIAGLLSVDPPSVAQLAPADAPGFVTLARHLRAVFADLRGGGTDAAAARLNDLLARHPAHPHLAREEDGRWRLHHHPVDAALVPMWTAICAEGLARMLSAGFADRLGTCEAPGCERVFLDQSKNASRRFCSTTCQNRVKAAAFRLRRAPGRR
jgi:predicted RNA-binding Zn ribbon-like protein